MWLGQLSRGRRIESLGSEDPSSVGTAEHGTGSGECEHGPVAVSMDWGLCFQAPSAGVAIL